jgi:hypothetical protein
MPKKWEYGIVHIDAKTGFLRASTFKTPMSMEDVSERAQLGTGDHEGTYGQGEWLRIAGSLG